MMNEGILGRAQCSAVDSSQARKQTSSLPWPRPCGILTYFHAPQSNFAVLQPCVSHLSFAAQVLAVGEYHQGLSHGPAAPQQRGELGMYNNRQQRGVRSCVGTHLAFLEILSPQVLLC